MSLKEILKIKGLKNISFLNQENISNFFRMKMEFTTNLAPVLHDMGIL